MVIIIFSNYKHKYLETKLQNLGLRYLDPTKPLVFCIPHVLWVEHVRTIPKKMLVPFSLEVRVKN